MRRFVCALRIGLILLWWIGACGRVRNPNSWTLLWAKERGRHGNPLPSGSYCAGGSAPAVACSGAGGSYCPASSSTNGVPCPSGSFCTGASAPAMPCACAAGFYSKSTSSSGCIATSGTCQPCAAGSACAGAAAQPVRCAAGTYTAGGASTCTTCGAGLVSNAQASGCVPGPVAAAPSAALPTIVGVSIAGGVIVFAAAIVLWRRKECAAASQDPPLPCRGPERLSNDCGDDFSAPQYAALVVSPW